MNVVIKDVEVAAEKVLNFLGKAKKLIEIAPTVVTALGVILGAVDKVITDVSADAAAGGLNITLDEETWSDLKAVWADVKQFGTEIGLKF